MKEETKRLCERQLGGELRKEMQRNKRWHKVAVWELVEGKESIAGVASQETGPKIRQFP